MALRVLIGIACIAVIAVSAVWIDDRFGVIAWATTPELTIEQLTNCLRIEREWREFSSDSRYASRANALEARHAAECAGR